MACQWKKKKIAPLRDQFENNFQVEGGLETKDYDMELPMKGLSPQTLAQINQVGPFGTGDPQPIFSISDPTITHFFLKWVKIRITLNLLLTSKVEI